MRKNVRFGLSPSLIKHKHIIISLDDAELFVLCKKIHIVRVAINGLNVHLFARRSFPILRIVYGSDTTR
jgi:hypothetical protein